ncbi:MAG: xanthine dehydrogenase [Oscillochloris sp.]|nr:xanthine dehydrogenase [Oscillochloris sp.]
MQIYPAVREAVRSGRSVATITLARIPAASTLRVGAKMLVRPDGTTLGALGAAELERVAIAAALPLLGAGITRSVEIADALLLIESFVPPPTLFMVGGVHISVALAALAKVLNFRTVVIDARSAFASDERFPHVDELVLAWPDEALEGRLDPRSSVAVLTHDPKLDDPALRVALRSPARYIGALGSPSTHAKRLERLRDEGFSDADLARIHGPIGLKIGAKTPEEIALSILSEVIQVQRAQDRNSER